ncbi:MAG: S-layer homology domain-containing protein [Lachnospiraceae bacterium]|nr:S-layer homology domain-containing protein [Lachnospiraceae bacterium]
MKLSKKLIFVISLILSLTLVLTACQGLPEGVDVSDLTSAELESLEQYLEASKLADSDEQSASIEDEENSVPENEEVISPEEQRAYMEAHPEEEMLHDESLTAEEELFATVVLPSGRDWVKYILDVAEYKRAYKDLQAAFGDDWDAYVDHYLTTGIYEGRDQGKLFDPWEYAAAYEDVREECGDDAGKIIEHYVTFGIKENRPIGTTQGYEDFADKTSREAMVGEAIDRTPSTRLEALIAHCENALTYGRNQEGATYPQLFVDGINPSSKIAPKWDVMEQVPSNLYSQNMLLKMLEGMTWITGDQKYQDAAYQQIQMRYDTLGLVDENGLFYAGPHSFVDVITGDYVDVWHEVKGQELPIELYYKVDPEGFEKFVTACWNAHIYDFSSLVMNRHGVHNKLMQNGGDIWSAAYTNPDPFVVSEKIPFVSSAIDLIEMAVFLSEKTGDPKYKAWGDRMLDKVIGVTNPDTGMTGAQYGVLYDPTTGDYEDRWLLNFAGADFVDNQGTDYKTLTTADYKIAGENMKTNRVTVKATAGLGPRVFAELYEMTGDETYYDFAKGNIMGFVRYMYDKERHLYNGYMMTNGTDVNPGKDNGPVLVAPRGGYYMTEGYSFPETEAIADENFEGMIAVCHMLKPEEQAEKQEIWDAIRAWGIHEGMGDLGTYMGENVNVNLQSTCFRPLFCVGLVSLYKYTGNQQYYDLAVRIADNIVARFFKEETGMFATYAYAPYTKFSDERVYAVFCVEAMTRGLLDRIDLDFSNSNFDIVHSQYGQRTDTELFYNRSTVKVKKVNLGAPQYSLILDDVPSYEINDVSGHEFEHAIRQMVALGVMKVDASGRFEPDTAVTRGELVEMVVELFDFNDTTVPADFRFTDVGGKPYYEAVVRAFNAGIIDENFASTLFDGEKNVNREELASILVRALQVATPNTTYRASNALYRIEDAGSISAWAREYCDIATNHRLMLDVEEVQFQPKLDVDKAMVAEIFQDALRYYSVGGLQKLTADVTPYDADFKTVTWETSDCTVVEVDQKGNLYPLKAGSAIITATAEGKKDTIEVVVTEKQDWMIKEVFFDGELYEDFSTDTKNYDINLHLGTANAPVITATSYLGLPVEIRMPQSLPGTVEMNVQGSDVVYKIAFDNSLVEYSINENFNHKIGTTIDKLETETYSWFINGTAENYTPYWKIIPKNWVRPDYEGYGCWVFPFRNELGTTTGRIRAKLNPGYSYIYGDEADDMLLIVEMEIAVSNLDGIENSYQISFMENGTRSIAIFNIDKDNELRRAINSTTYSLESSRILNDREFYNFRLVIDKKAKTFDYYLNDELLEQDVSARYLAVTGLHQIVFEIKHQDGYNPEPRAELFVDNLMVYELQRHVAEEKFSQILIPPRTPAPTQSPDPAYVDCPVNEDFDSFTADTVLSNVSGNHYTWKYGGGKTSYYTTAKIINRNRVEGGADAADKCVEIPYTHGESSALKLWIDIPANYSYALGGDKSGYIVVETEVALGGEGDKTVPFTISPSVIYPGYSVARQALLGAGNSLYLGNSSAANKREVLEKNTFYTLKWVIDRANKTCTVVFDDMQYAFNSLQHASLNRVGSLYITVPVEEQDVDASLYLDNVKIYITDTNPLPPPPTPRPTATPAPTADPSATTSPYIIDENWDGAAIGSPSAGTNYSYKFGSGLEAYQQSIKVISKNSVVSGAAEGDNCLEIPYTHSAGKALKLWMNIDDDKKVTLGSSASGYVVVEAEAAIKGTGKTTGFGISPSNNSTGGNSIARYAYLGGTDSNHLYHSNMNAVNKLFALEDGQFYKLKWVIDRTNKTCVIVFNGSETAFSALQNSGMYEVGGFYINIPVETTDVDTSLYLDNVKIYTTEAIPLTTPAPTEAPQVTMAPPSAESSVVADLDFDFVLEGTLVQALEAGENYTWATAGRVGGAKVVTKSSLIPDANAEDNCIVLTSASTTGGIYMIQLKEGKEIPLGYETLDNSDLVVEMDVAVIGTETSKSPIAKFYFGARDLNPVENQLLKLSIDRGSNTDQWVRMDGGEVGSEFETGVAHVGTTLERGRFAKLKVVVNRGTDEKCMRYYWDGQLVESSLTKDSQWLANSFGEIRIAIPRQPEEDDVRVYVDNIKVYTQESAPVPTEAPTTTPEATAEPTATPTPTVAPTESLYVIDENWDGIAAGTLINGSTGTNYSYRFGSGLEAYQESIKVVSKPGAAEGDNCLEIPYTHSAGKALKLWMNIDDDKKVTLGSSASGYVVVEAEVAIKGAGKTTGFGISPSNNSTGGNSIARYAYLGGTDSNHLYNSNMNVANRLFALENGQFYKLKWVIDRTNKTCVIVFNGYETAFSALQNSSMYEVGGFYINIPVETTDVDTSLYLDNVKVYTTETNPLTTP